LFFISFCPMRKMMNVLKLPCFKMHFITCTMLILQNLIFFSFSALMFPTESACVILF
jgi:hypothetical protein